MTAYLDPAAGKKERQELNNKKTNLRRLHVFYIHKLYDRIICGNIRGSLKKRIKISCFHDNHFLSERIKKTKKKHLLKYYCRETVKIKRLQCVDKSFFCVGFHISFLVATGTGMNKSSFCLDVGGGGSKKRTLGDAVGVDQVLVVGTGTCRPMRHFNSPRLFNGQHDQARKDGCVAR